MNHYLYEDMGDFVGLLPGLMMYDLGSAGQRLWFRIHGSSINQSVLSFDGRRFFDPLTGAGDLNFLPAGFIKQLSVQHNLFEVGVLSQGELLAVESESYQDKLPYSQVYHHKGWLGYSDVDFLFGQRLSTKMNILLGGDIKSLDGRDNAYLYNHQNLRAKLAYDFSPAWRFNFSVLNNRIERANPGLYFGDGNYSTPNARHAIRRDDFTLNLIGKILHSNWQNLQATVYYSSLYSKLSDNPAAQQNVEQSRYAGINFHLKQKLPGQLVTVGGEFEYNKVDETNIGNEKLWLGAVCLQDEWDWKGTIGIRGKASAHFHQIVGDQLSGGLSSYLKFSDHWKVTFSLQQSLRNPSFYELFANSDSHQPSSLKNEIQQQIDTGIETKILSSISISTFLYFKNIHRLIQMQLPDTSATFFRNGGDAHYFGSDISIQGQFGEKWSINTTVSFIDNQQWYDYPALILAGKIQYHNRFFENYLKTILRLESRYFSARKSIFVDDKQNFSTEKTMPAASVLNAVAIFGFGKLNFYFMLENIFNQEYQLVYGYPMNDRMFHYGVRWEFWD